MPQNLLQNRNYTIILAREVGNPSFQLPNIEEQWQIAEQSLVKIAQKCEEFAPEQLTIYVASQPLQKYNEANSHILKQAIQEGYGLDKVYIYEALKDALEEHFQRKEKGEMKENGDIILVILDNDPSKRSALIKLIVETTKKIDSPYEIGILFAQVGDNLMARGFLQALDDNLEIAGATVDIVDTKRLVELTQEQTLEFLLNAILD
ncbi:MAG: hypothetical protein AB4058_20380 [Microcystaceae cyanobacterium]